MPTEVSNQDVISTVGKLFSTLNDKVLKSAIEPQDESHSKVEHTSAKLSYLTGVIEANTVDHATIYKDIYKQMGFSTTSLLKTFDGIQEEMSDKFDSINNEIDKHFTSVNENINQAFEAINNQIDTKFEGLKTSVLNSLSKHWNSFSTTLSSVKSSVMSALSTLGGYVGAGIGFIKSSFMSAFNAISSLVTGIGSAASIGFGALKGMVTNSFKMMGGAIKGIKNAVSSAVGFIGDRLGMVKDFVFSAFSQMGSFLRISFEVITNPIEGLRKAFDGLKGFLFGGSLFKKAIKMMALGGIALLGLKKLYDNNPAFKKFIDSMVSKVKGFLFGPNGNTGIMYGEDGKGGVLGAVKKGFSNAWGWFVDNLLGRKVVKTDKDGNIMMGEDGKEITVRKGGGWLSSIGGALEDTWLWLMTKMFGKKVTGLDEKPKILGRDGKGWWSSIVKGAISSWGWFKTKLFGSGEELKKGEAGPKENTWWSSITKGMEGTWNWFMDKLFGPKLMMSTTDERAGGGWWSTIIKGFGIAWDMFKEKMFGADDKSGWWNEKLQPMFEELGNSISTIFFGNDGKSGLWNDTIKPVFEGLGYRFQDFFKDENGMWNKTIKPAMNKFFMGGDGERGLFKNLGNWITGGPSDFSVGIFSGDIPLWDRVLADDGWLGGEEGLKKELEPKLKEMDFAGMEDKIPKSKETSSTSPSTPQRKGRKKEDGRGVFTATQKIIGKTAVGMINSKFDVGGFASVVSAGATLGSVVPGLGTLAGAAIAAAGYGVYKVGVGLHEILTGNTDKDKLIEKVAKEQLRYTNALTKAQENVEKMKNDKTVGGYVTDMLYTQRKKVGSRGYEKLLNNIKFQLKDLSVAERKEKVKGLSDTITLQKTELVERVKAVNFNLRNVDKIADVNNWDDKKKQREIKKWEKMKSGAERRFTELDNRQDSLDVVMSQTSSKDFKKKVEFAPLLEKSVIELRRTMQSGVDRYVKAIDPAHEGPTHIAQRQFLEKQFSWSLPISEFKPQESYEAIKSLMEHSMKFQTDISLNDSELKLPRFGSGKLERNEEGKLTARGAQINDGVYKGLKGMLLKHIESKNIDIGPTARDKLTEISWSQYDEKEKKRRIIERKPHQRQNLKMAWEEVFSKHHKFVLDKMNKEYPPALGDYMKVKNLENPYSKDESTPPAKDGGIVKIKNNEAVISDLESKRGEQWMSSFADKMFNNPMAEKTMKPAGFEGTPLNMTEENSVVKAMKQIFDEQNEFITQCIDDGDIPEELMEVNKLIAENLLQTQMQNNSTQDATVAMVNSIAEQARNARASSKPKTASGSTSTSRSYSSTVTSGGTTVTGGEVTTILSPSRPQ